LKLVSYSLPKNSKEEILMTEQEIFIDLPHKIQYHRFITIWRRFMTIILALLLCGAFILFMWLWLIAPQMKNRPDLTEFRKFDYAHRGLHNNEKGIPENSLMSFRLAAEKGFGIELDLQLTQDKKVVVHHDHSLKRLCGKDILISDLTLDELYKYRLLNTDEPVPTLEQALLAVGRRVPLIVELKHYNETNEICTLTYDILKGYQGKYCVESFDPRIVRWFRINAPHIVRGQLMEAVKKNDKIGFLEAFLARNLCSNFLTRPNFEAYDYHKRRRPSMWLAKRVFAMPEVSWTVRDWKAYRKLKKEGCIIIFEGFEPHREPKKRPVEQTMTIPAATVNIQTAAKNREPMQ